MLWNKFQNYLVRFTLTNHVLEERFDDLTSSDVICREALILFTDYQATWLIAMYLHCRSVNSLPKTAEFFLLSFERNSRNR